MSVLTTCGGYGGQSDNSEDDDIPEDAKEVSMYIIEGKLMRIIFI